MVSENEIQQQIDSYLKDENLELYDLNIVNFPNISKIEGKPPERCTILEFESVEAAKAFYACEDYQGAKKKLDGKVDRVMFIIEGV